MARTLGKQLRELREERNLTLQQVAMGTHIRLAYLEALENDERELLPSAVQGKGFVRVIAGYLDVPVEPLLDLWEGKIPQEIAEPAEAAEPADAGQPVEEVKEEPAEPETTAVEPPEIEVAAAPDLETEPETAPIEEAPTGEAEDIFVQIGMELRRQRETISLTLDDVERFTKVRRAYLQALEDGRFDDLPSPVQGRGMLSNYANFLNLDTEALLLRFAEALQTRLAERPAGPAARGAPSSRPAPTTASPTKIAWRRLVTPDLVVGGVLFLSMLGFVIWGAARVSRLSAEASVVTPPSISEVLQMTATASTTPESQPSTAVTQNAPVQVEDTAFPPDPGAANGTDGTTESTGEAVQVTPGPPQGQAGPVQIHVIANQRAFLRIVADGETIFNGRVTPGSAYTFSAEEQLELLTGNAAALQVFYQQQDLGTLGLMGQMASLVFSAEGMITPTVQPSPTGQPTLTPTPTTAATSDEPAPTITPYIP